MCRTVEMSCAWPHVLTLSVHGQAVLPAVDGDGVQGQLVGGSEDTDGDFTAVGDEDLALLHDGAVGADASVDAVTVALMALVEDLSILVVDGRHGGQRLGGAHSGRGN